MPEFRVKLKRVTYAEVRVEANNAKEARQIVDNDGPHEWFVNSQTIDTDTTTIVSVKKEPKE